MATQTPSPEPDTKADQRERNAAYYLRVLHGLIDIGNDIVVMAHQRAKAQAKVARPDHADSAPMLEVTMVYDRITRSIRRSIMLALKIEAPEADASPPARHRIAARQQIVRGVEDHIQRHKTGAEAESLHAELLERLDGPDFDDHLADRPVAEIIAEICRDLGLTASAGAHGYKRRTPADIAVLFARAAAPIGGASPRGFALDLKRGCTTINPPIGVTDDDEPPWTYSPGIHRK